jgi:sirohydrochlorin cobaltochelatase
MPAHPKQRPILGQDEGPGLAAPPGLKYESSMPSAAHVILVGHGGLPSDIPEELVSELKRLEGQRRAAGQTEMGEREAAVDAQVRNWPRSKESDPYRAGLEAVAARLAPLIGERRLIVAYNEFCVPSVEDAIERAVNDGATSIVLLSTMFTPGGSHSEVEIPEIVETACRMHPQVDIRYAWPYDLDRVAEFLSAHLDDV